MVQSLGISVGNQNSYVAAGQGGGIEILLNEYSSRSTPSMVAFTDHARAIGVDASSNFFMNMKNTIYDLMLLVGKPYKEIISNQESADERPNYAFKLEEAENGEALVVVRHLGEERKFTITQVLAMLFTKLRGVAFNATDCVISCPQFFNDRQKDALTSAALISGLNPLQIISDMSAVVLNYAYYRTTKEDSHKFIAFINFGQSNLQSVVAWLTPKEDMVRILAAESEMIGGRDFDHLLANYFVDEHKLTLTPKAYLKLVFSCEKLKRQLSANANDIPIHVESLISEDKDFSARIDRSKFEQMSENLLHRVECCLRRCLDNARANFDKLISGLAVSAKAAEVARAAEAQKAADAAKKAEAAKAHRIAEEAKAKEASEAAAANVEADSPKETNDTEMAADTVKEGDGDAPAAAEPSKVDSKDDKSKETKSKPSPMESEPEELTKAKAEEQKAMQAAKAAKAAEKSMSSQANKLTKLADIKFDLQVVEMVGGSTRIPAIKQLVNNVFNLAPSTTLNTDEAVARGCALHCATLHPGMIVKREVNILGSESFSKAVGSSCDKATRLIEQDLIDADKRYMSRTEARNNLEEYIYMERSKLQEGDVFLNELSTTLDWLFSDEGEDAPEEEYLTRLGSLKKASESRLTENNK